ncbi:PIG-L domain-containing protein [Marinithermofilum abyssi]|uniref:PIG-L domain-containing protein n=1 Tax=Marinithermofilum abyssi TaxID=1571185 RepID=A0A8J2VGQ8_9BACL|nr:PIG-L family deacetylase [Marinithermofilum abyssi]GGE11111.1 PIG-L domain-containing protein [Marinithermofilum abyssi]
MSNRTLLWVFAHPDDESFACGGTIARYAANGWRTVLYCATRGDAGSPGTPPLCTPEQLGDVRADELSRAARVLGLDRVILRDYGDGRLTQYPQNELTRDIRQVIREEKPEVVITFPAEGISGHPDHRVIHQATVKAVQGLSQCVPRLYFVVIPGSVGRKSVPFPTPDDQVTHQIEVSPYREQIMRALQQHRTQHRSIERVFPGVMQGEWKSLRTREYYQAANPANDTPPDRLA